MLILPDMETIQWKIEGMSCSNCALTISKYLEKQGLQNVKLSLVSGDLSFDTPTALDREQIQKGIRGLGYGVVNEAAQAARAADKAAGKKGRPMDRYMRYLLICLPFTVLLVLPMMLEHLTIWGMGEEGQAMGRRGQPDGDRRLADAARGTIPALSARLPGRNEFLRPQRRE